MPRFAFLTQFIGTHFRGSQRQRDDRSVQGELERAMSIFFRREMIVSLASRVDAGVHARAMVGHFDLEGDLVDPPAKVCYSLNGILNKDISVIELQKVTESFHSRRDALWRTYRYRLRANSSRQPFDGGIVTYSSSDDLDLHLLNEQSKELVGIHNCIGLSRFCDDRVSPFCHIKECYWQLGDDGLYIFQITANHFLYKMVRGIIGTQLDAQSQKIPLSSLSQALKLKDRSYLGATAAACGLSLENISYKELSWASS